LNGNAPPGQLKRYAEQSAVFAVQGLTMKSLAGLLTLAIVIAAMNCRHGSSSSISNKNFASPAPSPALANRSLPCAVSDGDFSKTKELLASGAPVDGTADECIFMEPSPRGVTLLMSAAYLGKLETVKLLLDHGAKPNASDTYGETAVAYAVSGKHLDVIAALLDKGADINSKAELDRTPLMNAAGDGDVGVVNYLLDRGAKINATDTHGTTALMFAAGFNHTATARTLLRRGAKPEMKDHRGRTYLTYAKRGFPDEYLIVKM
jgi:uncharacterized protein